MISDIVCFGDFSNIPHPNFQHTQRIYANSINDDVVLGGIQMIVEEGGGGSRMVVGGGGRR